jgi:hypothetical protein
MNRRSFERGAEPLNGQICATGKTLMAGVISHELDALNNGMQRATSVSYS